MGEKKPALIGMSREEIAAILVPRNDAKLRAKQIAHQIYSRGENSFSEMADLPSAFRDELIGKFQVQPLELSVRKNSTDGVEKLLVHGGDNQVFECVLLPYADRVSSCLSSQVGCPMGCRFCATGLGGFDRNLSPGEIVGQYLMLQGLSDRPISHVVFMGMGEPLLNLKSVLRSLKLLHEEVGMSYRRMTVSTVGIVPAIYELAEIGLPIHLALSLHSPFDEIRSKLMPVNLKWSVREAVQAMRDYQKATSRKVTFEYLLIKNVTDTNDQARALANLVRGFPAVVNLIPFNWVDTAQGFARPDREQVRRFKDILSSSGINVTERAERGHDISAACGQLAGDFRNKKKRLEPLRQVAFGAVAT